MRILVTSLLFFVICSCYAPERDCANFKVGTFDSEAVVGSEVLTTRFVRNDSMEIDYFKGQADTSSIRWINDCEYIVKKLNPKSMAEEKAIHMKILTTSGDTYTFEYNVVGKDRKEKGTARKITTN